MKVLNITSTSHRDGKTMVALGLMDAFSKNYTKVGFMKPLGLSERKVADYSLDRDAALFERVFNLHANIKDINPVALDRDSLEYFSTPSKSEEVMSDIMSSYERISEGRDLMLIKGLTGAACGTVFGLANAEITKKIGAKVLILASGGVGQPLDNVVLNYEYFKSHNIEVVGVIFNKVFPQEIDVIRDFGASFLEKQGLRLLGVIPYSNALASPSLRDITERINGKVLAGEQHLGNHVGKIFVGSMTPASAWSRFENNCLLITGGDRVDMMLAAVVYSQSEKDPSKKFAGLLLTCGVEPSGEILDLLKKIDLPVICAEEDSYTVVSAISQMEVNISPADKQKITLVNDMIKRHVDVEGLIKQL